MKKYSKSLFILLFLVIGLFGNIYFIGPGSIMTWKIMQESSKNYIPTLQGINLVGDSVSFPEDLNNNLTLFVIGFKREQQKDIDTWIQTYNQKKLAEQKIDFFELPIIYEVGMVKRLFINNGMKMGIPDLEQRQRTVTIYMERQNLFDALEMKEDRIYSLLVDKKGEILWRSEGVASPEKMENLERAIKDYVPE